jgi:glycosyltransferase involved in cell wall biosynthesis
MAADEPAGACHQRPSGHRDSVRILLGLALIIPCAFDRFCPRRSGARRRGVTLRVAYVTPRADARDGWGRYATEIACAIRSCSVEPVLVTHDPHVDAAARDVELHAVLPALFTDRLQTIRHLAAAPRLRRVLSSCDVVHGVAEPYLPLVALAAGRRQPLVQTAHGTWAVRPFTSRSRRALHARALARVDLLVTQSHYTRDAMRACVPLPPSVVLTGGVRAEEFAPPVTAPERPAWCGNGPVAVTVGHVKRRKGIHVALQALALARGRHPELQLVVVGPYDPCSQYVHELRDLAAALDVTDAFHLTGEVPFAQLVAWYHTADVFVLLPVHDHGAFEGLGLAYLEAGAAGVPAIGTSDCGAGDAIEDGRTGLLVPSGDPAAAAGALCRLLEDRELHVRMGAAAQKRARVLSWSRVAEGLARHYHVLQQTRRGLAS